MSLSDEGRVPRIRSNFWKVYAYKLIGEFYLIVPILVPYYQANGLAASQVFTIQALYTITLLLLEIPSGYLADVIGRRTTLVLAAVFFPAGLLIYSLGRSFWAFVLAELVLSASGSLRSGCDSALLYDSLVELGDTERYKKIEGRSFFFTRLGTSAASILGGALAVVSIRLPFYVNVATGFLMLPLALLLTEPRRGTPEAENPMREILTISRWSFRQPRLRFFIAFMALLQCTGLVGLWAAFLYYQSLGITLGLFGALFAGFQLASGLGSRSSHRLERALGSGRALFLLPLAGVIFVALGTVPKSPAMIPLIYLNAFLWGASFPLFMDGINRIIPSETRATVLSVANMTGSLVFAAVSPLFGWVAGRFSLAAAYGGLGTFFLIYSALTLAYGRSAGGVGAGASA